MEQAIISAPLLLRDGRITGPGAVAIADGRIARVLDTVPPPGPHHLALPDGLLTPGLIDLHNNGAFGADFAEAAPEDWDRVLAGLAARGVTAVQPTVITAPLDAVAAAMRRAAAAVDRLAGVPGLARILGVHLEGPFIAEARRGAHNAAWMRDPEPGLLQALLDDPATRRMLRTVTLAPERRHGLEAVAWLAGQGIVVSVGHSDATAAQVVQAADAGARMVTHLFNAQRPFQHRDPGVPGAALTDARLFCGLIVDGQHVHPLGCRLAFQAAGPRIVAVTDSILTAGLKPGTTLEFGGASVANDADGVGRRPDGTIAGAGIVLDEGIRRMVAAGIDPALALTAATATAARAIGRDDLGALRPGVLADLVWWDDGFHPRRVWVGGQEVAGICA